MSAPKDIDALWQYIRHNGNKLDGSDFSGAFLAGFNFTEASLVGANFSNANLEGACFANCDISRANFSEARLGRACFFSATAIETDFSKIEAIAADFAMGDFATARFCGAELERANFTEANISGADFTEAALTNTVFAHTKLDHTNLAASFVGTLLIDVDLTQAKLLEYSQCEDIFVDTKTLELLQKAPPDGVGTKQAYQLLARAGINLPTASMPVAEPPIISSDIDQDDSDRVFDLINEDRVPLHVSQADLDAFRQALDTADDERPLQAFLEAHPTLLVAPLAANHRGWVIPQKKLGHQFIPDFVVGGLTSLGHEWLLVELESPKAKLFNQDGEASKILRHAIRQIQDWRDFLTSNLNYARNPRQSNGLGLRDISPDPFGLILIGRRASLDNETIQRRRRLAQEHRIAIHTYDYLIETCSKPPIARVPLIRHTPD